MERFGLDEVQAQAILEMRLKGLQGLDRRSWRPSSTSCRRRSPTSISFYPTRRCSGRFEGRATRNPGQVRRRPQDGDRLCRGRYRH